MAKAEHTRLFEEVGESAAEQILQHITDVHKELWSALQPQLAEHGALTMIKIVMRKTPHVIDSDEQLDLFPNMPRLKTFKRKKINLLKAGADQLEWYGDWWNRRLEGLAKRTEEDLAISGEIERLKRALKKYDPTGTVESALRVMNARDNGAKSAREKRRKERRKG